MALIKDETTAINTLKASSVRVELNPRPAKTSGINNKENIKEEKTRMNEQKFLSLAEMRPKNGIAKDPTIGTKITNSIFINDVVYKN